MNRNTLAALLGSMLITLFLPAPGTFAEIRSGRLEVQTEHMGISVQFGQEDERRIREYYKHRNREYRYDDDNERERKHKKRGKTPPGLAKRDRLPPGLEKQIERNGKLPPGLSGRLLPRELERSLPRLPERYVRVEVEGDVVILDRETSVVIDVIHDVHRLLTGR